VVPFSLPNQARCGKKVRKVKWTAEGVVIAWHEFQAKYRLTPSQAMGPIQRQRLPRDVANEGARIYNTALRLGVIDQAKAKTADLVDSKWPKRTWVSQDGSGSSPSIQSRIQLSTL
jgi:hypothetical protein